MSEQMPKAMKKMMDELDRTAVISETFKRRLIFLVSGVQRESYNIGISEGRRQALAMTSAMTEAQAKTIPPQESAS